MIFFWRGTVIRGTLLPINMKIIKIRVQGTQKEVEMMRSYLLKKHKHLILGKPRKGTNPKYDGNQKYSSYGDFKFDSNLKPVTRKRRNV